ncbi:MAG: phosphatidate cytidylyltransferase [Methylophilaceae bacterium]|nr:phosphatidate cytidylyltransferase [Methylophilaceae bacterium]
MFKTRLLTASVLVAGFLLALFLLSDLAWALLMLAIIGLAAWEWAGLAGFGSLERWFYAGLIVGGGSLLLPIPLSGAMVTLQHHVGFWILLAAVPFWLLLVPIWLLVRYRLTHKALWAVTGALVLVSAWWAICHLRRISPWVVLAVMVAIWIADSAAYGVGKAFGRHRLAPEISPGKTWEGVVGAWVAVTLYGVALWLILDISLWLLVGLWGMTVMSVMGDLFESLLKRQANVKDSGSILPGHGGILDRIDGLMPTLPLTAFYVHFPLYYTVLHE